jgi:integrase
VPKALRAVVGKAMWHAWLGSKRKGETNAVQRARALATEHDNLIASLEALSDAERDQIAAARAFKGGRPAIPARKLEALPAVAISGLEAWTHAAWVDKNIGLPIATKLVPMLESNTADDDRPDEMQLADMRLAADTRNRLEKLQQDIRAQERLARKLDGTHSGLDCLIPLRIKALPVAPKEPSINVWRRAVRLFHAAVGDRMPEDVTRDDVRAFRDYLEKVEPPKGRRKPDVAAMLGALHSLFETAIAEDIVAVNPVSKVKARRPDGDRKLSDDETEKSFTPEQIRLILSRIGELKKADDRTVTRLMIYSGARSGELCQLRASDVVRIDGIDALKITDAGDGKTIKNKASIRTVPLHPQVRDEIVKLAEHVRIARGADARLFPSYKFNPAANSWSRRYQDRFSYFIRARLNIGGGLSTHNLRHTWIDASRNVEMPEYISEAITGHAPSGGNRVHRGYGKGVALKIKAKWIRRVDPARG